MHDLHDLRFSQRCCWRSKALRGITPCRPVISLPTLPSCLGSGSVTLPAFFDAEEEGPLLLRKFRNHHSTWRDISKDLNLQLVYPACRVLIWFIVVSVKVLAEFYLLRCCGSLQLLNFDSEGFRRNKNSSSWDKESPSSEMRFSRWVSGFQRFRRTYCLHVEVYHGSWTWHLFDPWSWMRFFPAKRRWPLHQRRCVTSQKNGILQYASS
jgi:hypothetical protein